MQQDLMILDGGMGVELLKRGSGSRTELWSAQALLDAPEEVLAVHADYIAAGARMIITNSYSTIPSYLGKLDMADRYLELTGLAAGLARQAADAAAVDVLVAGSLPPLSESYRADLVPADDEASPIYESLVIALNGSVDLFLCETMSCVREAANAAQAATQLGGGKPVYVSWTLDETPGQGLRSGESIADAVDALAHLDVAAMLFNCTSVDAIEAGLRELRQLTAVPVGAYPNLLHIPSGWTLDDNSVPAQYQEMTPAQFVNWAERFVAAGATILGGCCGIGPEHISALSSRYA